MEDKKLRHKIFTEKYQYHNCKRFGLNRNVVEEMMQKYLEESLKNNPEYTWEFNLKEKVRWGTDDTHNDVCFYVKEWLEEIADEEGFILIKKDSKSSVSRSVYQKVVEEKKKLLNDIETLVDEKPSPEKIICLSKWRDFFKKEREFAAKLKEIFTVGFPDCNKKEK